MPTARVDGVDLSYELAGSGPRVLFCNGSGATLEGARPLLAAVARSVELLAFDQRGIGASGPAPAPYGMARLAADAQGLLDAVGWDTAAVVGVSFGGMVAQELAVTAPERVERLALLCTSPGGAGGSSYPLHELEALPPDERAAARARLLDERFDEAVARRPPRRPGPRRPPGRPRTRRRPGRGGRAAGPARGPAGPRRVGPPPVRRLPDARGLRPLRPHRPAGQRRGHRVPHTRRRAPRLRGRPRLLRPGPRRAGRPPHLPAGGPGTAGTPR